MSEDYVLELEHIRKEYPGVVALKDVTLQLRRGEVLGLIGENGAGKSTLIKCCSGAVIPTSGKIKINGKKYTVSTKKLTDPKTELRDIYECLDDAGSKDYITFMSVKDDAAEKMDEPAQQAIGAEHRIIRQEPN